MRAASHFSYITRQAPVPRAAGSCATCHSAFGLGREAVVLVCKHTTCKECARQNVSGDVIRCIICQAFTPVAVLQGAVPGPLAVVEEEEPPTNVFEVQLYSIAQESAIATGEPVYCKQCRAVLNSYSQVERRGEVTLWACEFCRTANEVVIDEGEMPKSNEIVYVLDPGMQVEEESKVVGSAEGYSVVFCLDISGSMGTCERTAGTIRAGSAKAVSQATRLDCVRLAIQSQLDSLSRASPGVFAGLITFNNDVEIVGDGTIPSTRLSPSGKTEVALCRTETAHMHKVLMGNPVAATKDALAFKLNALKPRGGTALGPALAAGIELASQGAAGSKVIMCTDGLANQGFGKIEGELPDVAQEFYNEVGAYAQQKGVGVSVISVASGDCKLSYLSYVADLTEGSVLKVDPANLLNDFSAILAEKIIATEVQAFVVLHKALKFKNESPESLEQGGSKLHKNVGNVTQLSEFTFEYSMKNSEELAIEELENLKQVPFQLLLEYKNKKGQRMLKCITKVLQATSQVEEAKREANVAVIANNFEKQAARMVKEGRYQDFKSHNVKAQRWAEANQAPAVQVMQRDWDMLNQEVMAQESLEMHMGMGVNEAEMAKPRLEKARRANMSDHTSVMLNKFSKKRS